MKASFEIPYIFKRLQNFLYFFHLSDLSSVNFYECIKNDCNCSMMRCSRLGSQHCLTHWGWVTHKRISKLTIIGSENGLIPGGHQAIIWTNDGILLIGPLRTNFSEILIEIHTFSFRKMDLKMSAGKWQPFCLSLSVLSYIDSVVTVYSLALKIVFNTKHVVYKSHYTWQL